MNLAKARKRTGQGIFTLGLTGAGAILAVWALLAVPGWGGDAWALSGEALERRVHEVSDQLRCPTCQAISVNDSEAAFSRQIREKVRLMLVEGQSEEQIKAFFVSRYGEWILRAPKKEGLGLVLWILPGLAILGVGGWIGFKAHRSAQAMGGAARGAEGGATHAPLSEAQRQRLERDRRLFEDED